MADLSNSNVFRQSGRTQVVRRPTFAGVAYPLPASGVVGFVADAKAINASLLQLFLTEPGERLFEPEFGTPLRDIIFQPQDPIIYQEIAMRIARSIEMWEKRIILVSPQVATQNQMAGPVINVGPLHDSGNKPVDHTVMVSFFYAYKTNVQEVFTFSDQITRAEMQRAA